MHIYIYDSFLQSKKYEGFIAKIETRITDLGLNGKIVRLGLLQSLTETIRDEIKKGAKTIIAVGGNSLLHQCINAVMNCYPESSVLPSVPIGFIPVNPKDSSLAPRLAIPVGVEACNILSARRVESLDLGKINECYFLSEALITTEGTTVSVDKSYSIEINEIGEIAIINISNTFKLPDNCHSNAKDGKLEFYIKTKANNKFLSIGNRESTESVFSFTELMIENKNSSPILLDSVQELSTPAKIRPSQKKLNLIVGKGAEL